MAVRVAPGVGDSQVSVGKAVAVSEGSAVAVAGSGDALGVGVGGVIPEATATARAVAVSATAGMMVGRAVGEAPGKVGSRVAMGTATSQPANTNPTARASARQNTFWTERIDGLAALPHRGAMAAFEGRGWLVKLTRLGRRVSWQFGARRPLAARPATAPARRPWWTAGMRAA
jgi:hypothetical protein